MAEVSSLIDKLIMSTETRKRNLIENLFQPISVSPKEKKKSSLNLFKHSHK